ncbi:ELO family [Trinorchestia longiramus]|nr:ELO family [Trinorchestia longiramus]
MIRLILRWDFLLLAKLVAFAPCTRHCTRSTDAKEKRVVYGRWWVDAVRCALKAPVYAGEWEVVYGALLRNTFGVHASRTLVFSSFETPEINHLYMQDFLDNRVGGFWNWMFTLSKVPELGDTVFIVLRKQPLIFLHWYHHVTVLLYAWYSYSDYIATARWFVCMNYLVHSVMYSYYALKALKFKVSRYVAMFITTAQLAQMIMGAAVNIWAYQVKEAGNECHVSYENIKISLIMYTSYFVLFAHFFRRAYMKKPVTADQKPITNGVSNGAYHYDKSKKGSKFE